MITTTAQQIIRSALLQLGAISASEQPTAGEASDAFRRLNELIDDWGTQPLTFRTESRAVASLVSGQQTYTIGTGGDFNITPRPDVISNVQLQLTSTTPDTEIPLSPLTQDAYQAVAQKDLENALPTSYYLEYSVPLASVWIWPIPDASANELVIYYPVSVAQFASLTASVTLAPALARALRTNLAVELGPEFGIPVSPDLRLQAGDALAVYKRSNVTMCDLALDPGLTSSAYGGYNIYTDTGS